MAALQRFPRSRHAAIVAIVTILVVVPILAVERVQQLRSSARDRWLEDLSTALAITTTGIETWVQERRADGRVAAQQASSALARLDDGGAGGPDAGSVERTLPATLEPVRRGYAYRAAWALDANGRVVAAAGAGATLTNREREAAIHAMAAETDSLLGPYLDSAMVVRGDVIAPVLGPPAKGAGPRPRAVGAIVLAFDPRERLIPLALGNASTGGAARGRFIVRVPDGQLSFAWSPDRPGRRGGVVIDSSGDRTELSLALAGDTAGRFARSDGDHELAATRRLRDGAWAVMRAVREHDAYDAVRTQLQTDALNMVALGGLVLLSAMAYSRHARSARMRALADSEARYRLLAEHATDLITRHGVDGRYLYVSPAARAMLGYEPEELLGRSPYDFFHPDDVPRLHGTRERLVATSEPAKERYRYRRRDGSYVWLESRVGVVGTEEGEAELVAVSRDVTHEQHVSETLHRQALLFEALHDGVLLMDPDWRVVDCNAAAEQIFGYGRDELLGRDQELVHHPDVRAALAEGMRAALGRDGRWEGEVRFRRRSGEDGLADAVVVAVHDARGTVTGLIGVHRDITMRRRVEDALRHSEDQLRQSQKMEAIGRLAGGVAHDFNNLLTAITSNAAFALRELPAEAPAWRDINEIVAAAERATRLTRQLLAFSRRQVLQPRVVDVNAAVRRAEDMFRRLIGENITLVASLDPAAGCATVDPGQLDQVMLNLVLNARDAMPGGGTLTIETARVHTTSAEQMSGLPAGEYARVCIRDTGMGMTDDVRARIFEPFFTSKELGKGTGLGLSTTYGIVRQSAGYIFADSTPGRGSAFTVYLPSSACLPDDVAPLHTAAAPLPGGSETVLLAEDEEAVRNSTHRILTRQGHTVLSARDGREALALSEEYGGAIDLLVTDVVMPAMGGRELAERVRARRPGLKVLFMSGYNEEAVAMHGILASDAAFIEKPFAIEDFARRVRDLLDARQPAGR